MELLLNLIWLAVSVVLVVMWRRGNGFACGSPRKRRTALIALLVLALLLLPVISVTDDLVAMASPESEHGEHLLRRSAVGHDLAVVLHPGALAAQVFLGLAFLSTLLWRVVQPTGAHAVLRGFGDVTAIRPPPSRAALAA